MRGVIQCKGMKFKIVVFSCFIVDNHGVQARDANIECTEWLTGQPRTPRQSHQDSSVRVEFNLDYHPLQELKHR